MLTSMIKRLDRRRDRSRRKKVKGEHDASTRIKVQLDHKTMMIVHSMSAFKMWKKRYPLARVIAWFPTWFNPGFFIQTPVFQATKIINEYLHSKYCCLHLRPQKNGVYFPWKYTENCRWPTVQWLELSTIGVEKFWQN